MAASSRPRRLSYRMSTASKWLFMRMWTNWFVDTHFGEGTLMPYLSNWLIFTLVPKNTPWFIRWIIKPVMERIKKILVVPNVENAANLVRTTLLPPLTPVLLFMRMTHKISLDWGWPFQVHYWMVRQWSWAYICRFHDALPNGDVTESDGRSYGSQDASLGWEGS
jgi:hypothetical protein